MDLPGLQRMAKKYQVDNVIMKKKAAEEHRKANSQIYKREGKGQRDLHRRLKGETAAPLVAVRRVEKGPRGQQIRTIATTPKEIDSIIRKGYWKIYKGNRETGEDPEAFANKYMEDHKKYTFRQKELSLEQVRGEYVEEAIRGLKETAGGLDQWGPADLKLLPKEACNELANFFNMIGGGASWPKQLNVARAAFLATEAGSDMDPLAYRLLLMLPSVYRLWER